MNLVIGMYEKKEGGALFSHEVEGEEISGTIGIACLQGDFMGTGGGGQVSGDYPEGSVEGQAIGQTGHRVTGGGIE